jgi:hypothetical protein
MYCPVCKGKSVGKVGVKHFFCRDCCVEIFLNQKQNQVRVYQVEDDGKLVLLSGADLML